MFYIKGIDITNDKQMFEFINNHFRYYTANSWNRGRSIAHNVKIYNLNLSGDHWTALTFLQDDDYFVVNMMIKDWEAEHRGYKVGFNGRSGGYLVLYNATGGSAIPDTLDYDNYEDYKADMRDYYGSVKANRNELRDFVKLVQDFDRLCDEIRDYVDDLSNRNFLIEAMKESVERFNEQYSEDLEYLGFDPLYVELDKVDISEISQVVSLYEAFIRVASKRDLGYRIERIGDYVYYVVD
jgi:hypothetical protein